MPEGVVPFDDLVPPDHHLNWNRAFDRAVQDAARGLQPGEKATFTVKFEVDVTRTNPGWADGYKAILDRKNP